MERTAHSHKAGMHRHVVGTSKAACCCGSGSGQQGKGGGCQGQQGQQRLGQCAGCAAVWHRGGLGRLGHGRLCKEPWGRGCLSGTGRQACKRHNTAYRGPQRPAGCHKVEGSNVPGVGALSGSETSSAAAGEGAGAACVLSATSASHSSKNAEARRPVLVVSLLNLSISSAKHVSLSCRWGKQQEGKMTTAPHPLEQVPQSRRRGRAAAARHRIQVGTAQQ